MCSANINVHAHIYDNIIIKKKHMQNFIQKKIQLFISIPNITLDALLSMADCECRWQEPRGRLDLRAPFWY